jgi:hypothetical protein
MAKRWWIMTDDKELGSLVADDEWIANEVFLLSQKRRIYPVEAFLIAEIDDEDESTWTEVRDEDIISIEEIQL